MSLVGVHIYLIFLCSNLSVKVFCILILCIVSIQIQNKCVTLRNISFLDIIEFGLTPNNMSFTICLIVKTRINSVCQILVFLCRHFYNTESDYQKEGGWYVRKENGWFICTFIPKSLSTCFRDMHAHRYTTPSSGQPFCDSHQLSSFF